MLKNKILLAVAAATGVALSTFTIVAQQDDETPEMGMFITSVGIGDGGNLSAADIDIAIQRVIAPHILRAKLIAGG